MSVSEKSRNATDLVVVELQDPVSGFTVKPPYLDYRPRFTDTAPDDKLIIAKDSDGWPHIAAKALGDPSSWWVVADLSNVVDPIEDGPVRADGVSLRLRCPSASRFNLDIISGERPDRL
jgi:hypothetical protein